jgi:EH domain-containing protein 1
MLDMNYLTNVGNIHVMQTDSDFDAKPQVMLLGQYSTGKTTFIKHLLRTSYPGAHIGPEPTTDRFVVVMVGASSP